MARCILVVCCVCAFFMLHSTKHLFLSVNEFKNLYIGIYLCVCIYIYTHTHIDVCNLRRMIPY